MEQRLSVVCKRDVIRIGDIIDSQTLIVDRLSGIDSYQDNSSQAPMFRDSPRAGMLGGLRRLLDSFTEKL